MIFKATALCAVNNVAVFWLTIKPPLLKKELSPADLPCLVVRLPFASSRWKQSVISLFNV